MAVKFPQFDLLSSYGSPMSGAADAWDSGVAGELLTADYFTEPASVVSRIKVRVAGAWVEGVAKVRIAGAWVIKPVKIWNGTTWIT